LPGIDITAGLKIAQGKVALYRRLLLRFRDSGKAFSHRYNSALVSGDLETATRYAHSLKSEAGNVGAGELQQAAAELERISCEGAARKSIDAALAQVSEKLVPILKGFSASGDFSETAATVNENETAVSPRLLELMNKMEAMLRDDDADAVEVAAEMANHDFGASQAEVFSTLARQINTYNFEDALSSLAQLRKIGITDEG
jgi:HPt (histidine-containing phosphotransfer) domain-containing protein